MLDFTRATVLLFMLRPFSPAKAQRLLLLIATLTILAGAIIAPSLPKLIAHLHANGMAEKDAAFWSKALLSIPALVIVFIAPVMGYIIDTFGRRPIMLTGLFLFGCFGALGGLFPSFYVLLFSRMGLGLAVTMNMTAAITLISDYFEGSDRAKIMGYFSSAMSFGGIVYFILAGFLASWDWRLPFSLYLIAWPILWAAYLYLPEPEICIKDASLAAAAVTPPKKSLSHFKDASSVAHTPSSKLPFLMIGMIYITAILLMASYYCIPIQVPFVLQHLGFTSPTYVGVTVASSSVFLFFTALIYGRVAKDAHPAIIFALGFGLFAFGYGVIAFSKGYTGLVVGLCCAGVGFGLIMPNLGTWLMKLVTPERKGRVFGGMSSSLNLGQFLSPLVVHSVSGAPFLSSFVTPACLSHGKIGFVFFSIVALGVSIFYISFFLCRNGKS